MFRDTYNGAEYFKTIVLALVKSGVPLVWEKSYIYQQYLMYYMNVIYVCYTMPCPVHETKP